MSWLEADPTSSLNKLGIGALREAFQRLVTKTKHM
jgi:hypothetical protein